MEVIRKELLEKGIPGEKINCEYISTQVNARINFLRDFSKLHENLPDDIAVGEGGVFQGDFAKEINHCFPKNECFLFDTFEGFDERDLRKEYEKGFSIIKKNHLSNTSVDLVLGKMPFPGNVKVKKGFFPETTVGLEGKIFFFVNLDFDLYNPTLDGLRFFYPRLYREGVILIHDYYNSSYTGIKAAVDDFENEWGKNLCQMPIGDHCSIAIIKTC